MSSDRPAHGIPLQRLIALAIVASMLLLTLSLLLQGRHGLRQAMISAASHDVGRLGGLIGERAERLLGPARSALYLLRHDPLAEATSLQQRLDRLPVLQTALALSPALSAVYAGYPNGDFLLMRPLDRGTHALRDQAPAEARYLVQSIAHDQQGRPHGEWRFYDAGLRLLQRQARPDHLYDPRSRPWFGQAQSSPAPVLTTPYVFFTTGQTGVSLALRSREGGTVFGMDAAVEDLSLQVAALRMTPGTEIAVLDREGQVFIHHDPRQLLVEEQGRLRLAHLDELPSPSLARLQALRGDPAQAQAQAFTVQDATWYGIRRPLATFDGAELLVAIPQGELFVGVRRMLIDKALLASALILPMLLGGWWLGRRIGNPLRQLAAQLAALGDFDFRRPPRLRSRVREVRQLGEILQRMAGSLQNLQTLTHTLNRESCLEDMLDRVLQQLVGATALTGGAVYLFDSESASLRLANRCRDGAYPDTFSCGDVGDAALIAHVTGHFAERDYLCVPLRSRTDALLGLLALRLTAEQTETGTRASFRRFAGELAGAAAVAIETRQLIESQQRLIDAVIRLLADAIDAKSPYTGGHCERVPQLAIMLLDAAVASEEGSFAGFHMNATQRYEFTIAAWLHDCGKITTPEHVVDKATKLETLYNRIHEIRTRFEVLWRDAEIDYWRGLAEGGDPGPLQDRLRQRQAGLQEDFAFIAACNIGSEGMSDEDVARLERLAGLSWWRHFDDRLGLSVDEQTRLQALPAQPLPCREPLLADRPEHLRPWGTRRPPVARGDPDNRWGFDMRLPEHAFNHGELHNLRVRRGTLTEEERFKINEHIVQTLIMLDSLPFPPHLRRVPDIAANHHEKMDGSGYPRRLSREALSLPERIMAIADIFEALTASDRPYKRPTPLSVALAMMARMAREAHIDAEVFALFLRSGVYLDYARRFLPASQIDPVDVAACLAGLPVADGRRAGQTG